MGCNCGASGVVAGRTAVGVEKDMLTKKARVRSALVWLIALFGSDGRVLLKTIPYVFPVGGVQTIIFTDASPWGGSGYFAGDGTPVSYWHDEWTEADLKKFRLKSGDCRGQAVWEALALLVAPRVWSGA